MTTVNRNIVDTYSGLFEGLDNLTKTELIKRLTKSLNKEKDATEKAFYKSFGSFPDDRPAEEITEAIKASRKFREKDFNF